MSIPTSQEQASPTGELQLATFYVGDILLGLEIEQVQEINRRLDVTMVPHAPRHVRGVINLRGEVVTVVDLRTILGLTESPPSSSSRNLIVSSQNELIGLCVDRIADIVAVPIDDIDQTPSNVEMIDSNLLRGVYPLDHEIVVILNLDAALSGE